ncbi:MAG: cupin domain-containing protein [Terriglobales bacterium]
MLAFRMNDLLDTLARSGKPYREFLRTASMSAGVYSLPAGSEDKQTPHTEDEIYYVVKGRAKFFLESKGPRRDREVGPGSVIFVGAKADHRFHSITEDLVLLVFFAPPEKSRRKKELPSTQL